MARVRVVQPPPQEAPLTETDRLAIYRTMFASRRIDDKEIQLKNQNQIYFQISGAGHEAMLTAAAALPRRPGYDWFYPVLPRPRAVPAARRDAARDAAAGGRRARRPELRRPPDAVALGPQAAQHRVAVEPHRHAVPARGRLRRSGVLYGGIDGDSPTRGARSRRRGRLRLVGDGATSEGEFWEALNTACNLKLPVLFLSKTTATRSRCRSKCRPPAATSPSSCSASRPLASGVRRHRLPGVATRRGASGVAYVRARKGPALVHAHVIRPYSHSLSDDEKLYRRRERARAKKPSAIRSPLSRSSCDARHRRQPPSAALEAEVDAEIEAARERGARPRRSPARDRAALWVYSPDVDPTSAALRQRPRPPGQARTMVDRSTPPARTRWRATRASSSSAKTWPTRRARRRWPRSRARAASSR